MSATDMILLRLERIERLMQEIALDKELDDLIARDNAKEKVSENPEMHTTIGYAVQDAIPTV